MEVYYSEGTKKQAAIAFPGRGRILEILDFGFWILDYELRPCIASDL